MLFRFSRFFFHIDCKVVYRARRKKYMCHANYFIQCSNLYWFSHFLSRLRCLKFKQSTFKDSNSISISFYIQHQGFCRASTDGCQLVHTENAQNITDQSQWIVTESASGHEQKCNECQANSVRNQPTKLTGVSHFIFTFARATVNYNILRIFFLNYATPAQCLQREINLHVLVHMPHWSFAWQTKKKASNNSSTGNPFPYLGSNYQIQNCNRKNDSTLLDEASTMSTYEKLAKISGWIKLVNELLETNLFIIRVKCFFCLKSNLLRLLTWLYSGLSRDIYWGDFKFSTDDHKAIQSLPECDLISDKNE